MLAVIKTGGKQYLVSPGEKIKINLSPNFSEEGKEISFDEVLLLEKNQKVEVGNPTVKGARVLGKILEKGRGDKVTVFKQKPKKRYKVKKGHRQPYTLVEISKIEKK